MAQPVSVLIRSVLAEGLTRKTGTLVRTGEIRLPARGADAAWPGSIRLGLDAIALANKLYSDAACFPGLFGLSPVRSVSAKNGWLLFSLEPGVFDAALGADPRPLPPERPEDDELRLKLFMLARHDPAAIPADPALYRALLLLWAAEAEPSRARCETAVRALLATPLPYPPEKRPAYAVRLGAPARLALDLWDSDNNQLKGNPQ